MKRRNQLVSALLTGMLVGGTATAAVGTTPQYVAADSSGESFEEEVADESGEDEYSSDDFGDSSDYSSEEGLDEEEDMSEDSEEDSEEGSEEGDTESEEEDTESESEGAESGSEGVVPEGGSAESGSEGAAPEGGNAESGDEDAQSEEETAESGSEGTESESGSAESGSEDAASESESAESGSGSAESGSEDAASESESAESGSEESLEEEARQEAQNEALENEREDDAQLDQDRDDSEAGRQAADEDVLSQQVADDKENEEEERLREELLKEEEEAARAEAEAEKERQREEEEKEKEEADKDSYGSAYASYVTGYASGTRTFYSGTYFVSEAQKRLTLNIGFKQVAKVYAVPKNGFINIREGRTEDARIVGVLEEGSLCYILESGSDAWVFVESGDVRGFVKTNLLKSGAEVDRLVRKTGEDKMKLAIQKIDPLENQAYRYTLTTTRDVSALMSSMVNSSVSRDMVVQFARQFVGNPYIWGGNSLTNGTDCSGFTQQVYAHFGISIPRLSYEQAESGVKIPVSEAKPGDLIFYARNGVVYHVVIYAGDGKAVNAGSTMTGIILANVDYENACWACRYLDDTGASSGPSTQASQLVADGREAYNGDEASKKVIIEALAKASEKEWKEIGFCRSVLIAQTIEESGWMAFRNTGSGIQATDNNVLGMNVDLLNSRWVSPWTGASVSRLVPQYVNGQIVYGFEDMRVYQDIEACMVDYAAFKIGLHPELRGVNDVDAVIDIGLRGYATNPNYQSNIRLIIDKYNLTQYDTPFVLDADETIVPGDDLDQVLTLLDSSMAESLAEEPESLSEEAENLSEDTVNTGEGAESAPEEAGEAPETESAPAEAEDGAETLGDDLLSLAEEMPGEQDDDSLAEDDLLLFPDEGTDDGSGEGDVFTGEEQEEDSDGQDDDGYEDLFFADTPAEDGFADGGAHEDPYTEEDGGSDFFTGDLYADEAHEDEGPAAEAAPAGMYRTDPTDYSASQLELIWAVVAEEDDISYDGALAVISAVMNRADQNFGGFGTTAFDQITADGQYCYSSAVADPIYYQRRLGGNVPDYVKQAVEDCLKNGFRSHSYNTFSGSGDIGGAVQIGSNWYYDLSGPETFEVGADEEEFYFDEGEDFLDGIGDDELFFDDGYGDTLLDEEFLDGEEPEFVAD